ncbi:hypothetical protein PIIN_08664 [Serendipita indica DSM 11827]|uniref:Uncharacterized protein n=1 Tax=Serendipita indica (strain DSM 11827) TaxID=1109443 RepID=G4TTR1_SERID|nr:hypothetical protein PIIN_08664 [Serendipita indica DSM 11827]
MLLGLTRNPIYKPPTSLLDILVIQRTVYSLSKDCLSIFGGMPSDISPLRLEEGFGRTAREPSVRAFLRISGPLGSLWRRVRSRQRPTIDIDLENVIHPYYGHELCPSTSSITTDSTLGS